MSYLDNWSNAVLDASAKIRNNWLLDRYPLIFRGYSVKLIGANNDAILNKADNDNEFIYPKV